MSYIDVFRTVVVKSKDKIYCQVLTLILNLHGYTGDLYDDVVHCTSLNPIILWLCSDILASLKAHRFCCFIN